MKDQLITINYEQTIEKRTVQIQIESVQLRCITGKPLIQALYTIPIGNPLLPCQYRGDVVSRRTRLYTECTTKRRSRAICLAGVRATVKPINAIMHEADRDRWRTSFVSYNTRIICH